MSIRKDARGVYEILGWSTREDIDRLLLDKLPEVLTESQKMDKIHNLLNSLARKQGKIRNVGSRRFPKWVRAETGLKKTVE